MIEQLIQMKKVKDSNDIVKMLDEFTLYDKLSDIKALGDIESSKAMQSRLPFLAKLVESNFYQLSLAFIARDILNHLSYEIPAAIHNHIDSIPEKTKKQIAIAGKSTVNAEYRELRDYHEELNKDGVVGIYTNKIEEDDFVRIIIIVDQKRDMYTIYQGSYEEVEGELVEKGTNTIRNIEGHVVETNKGKIKIKNYSIQGNNSYPFAIYEDSKSTYYISIPDREHLAMSKGSPSYWDVNEGEIKNKPEFIPLTTEEINRLGVDRNDIDRFATSIAKIINRWEVEK